MKFKRSDKAVFSDIGDDVVALNTELGRCYGMENVAAEIWNIMNTPVSIGEICERLTEGYDVEPDTCRREVDQFLELLVEGGLATKA